MYFWILLLFFFNIASADQSCQFCQCQPCICQSRYADENNTRENLKKKLLVKKIRQRVNQLSEEQKKQLKNELRLGCGYPLYIERVYRELLMLLVIELPLFGHEIAFLSIDEVDQLLKKINKDIQKSDKDCPSHPHYKDLAE